MITKIIRFNYSKLQEKLIENSLPFVHKYGWSDNAIHAACSNMDLSPAAHRLIKPYDLISYSMKKWNKAALRIIDDSNFNQQKKIHTKIHFAIKTRLQQQLQYIDTWNEAMAIGAHPNNVEETKNILWDFSDEVWHRCGDKSTDYNYYTKRILFNGAYATTELHLLTDQSPEKRSSWQFLSRRLQDILTLGKTANDLKTVGSAALEGAWSLLSILKEPNRQNIRRPISEMKTGTSTQNKTESIQEQKPVQSQK